MSSTPNNIVTCNCPDCKQPLDYYLQSLHPKSTRIPSWIGTCRTVDCTLHHVTLADEGWTQLATDENMASQYRAMVAQMAGAK